jgi:hypothetical protein
MDLMPARLQDQPDNLHEVRVVIDHDNPRHAVHFTRAWPGESSEETGDTGRLSGNERIASLLFSLPVIHLDRHQTLDYPQR